MAYSGKISHFSFKMISSKKNTIYEYQWISIDPSIFYKLALA